MSKKIILKIPHKNLDILRQFDALCRENVESRSEGILRLMFEELHKGYTPLEKLRGGHLYVRTDDLEANDQGGIIRVK